MKKLLALLLLLAPLSHAAVTIVQRAHGIVAAGNGTISFSAPTVAGRTIIAVMTWPSTGRDGLATTTDNGGNNWLAFGTRAEVANTNLGGTLQAEAAIYVAQEPATNTTAARSMQTLTLANWDSPGDTYGIDVWLYEVSGLAITTSPAPAFTSVKATSNIQGVGPGSTPTFNPLAPAVPAGDHCDATKECLFLAAAVPTVASISSVAGPWTLEPTQNGYGAAYLITQSASDQQAIFTNGSSSPYGSIYASFAGLAPAPTGSCPGLPAGTPLSACLSGVALAGGNAGWQVPTKPRLTITKAGLAGGTIGTAYSQQLTAVNGITPFTWSILLGTLPPGLSLNSSTGVISGTPTATGNYPFTVLVTDSTTPTSQTATKDMSITVNCPQLVQTSTSPLPPGTTGSSYSFQFQSTGGQLPLTWTGTNIPAGLAVSVTGLLNGIPTGSGTTTLNITATDSCTPTHQAVTLPFDLTINSVITINSTSPLPAGPLNVPYSVQLSASGGTVPYTWTITSGTLPTGLSLSASGAISGTPTVAGTSTFTARVADTSGHFNSKPFAITIGCPALTITSQSPLPDATQGIAYNFAFQFNGGTAPVTWSSGTLPNGLTLSSSGVLSGTPTTSGTFTFNVTATDNCSTPQVVTLPFTITISGGLVITTASPLPSGTVNQAYNTQLQAQGGVPPYTWSVPSGPIPNGAIDMLDWELMPLPDRNNFHLTGGLAPRYARLDGGLIWQMKSAAGNPWDGNWYDDQYVYLGFTDNNDSSQQAACQAAGFTSCFVDPFAYKMALTLRRFTPRYFVPGTTVTILTPPVLTGGGQVNPRIRTTNCGADNQGVSYLGNVKTVTSGPNNPPAFLVGNNVTATTPTIETDYYYSGDVTGTYQNRERFWFVKGLGWAGWDHALWNGTSYDPPDMVSADNHKVAGGLTSQPNFGCGVPSLPITGKLPDGVSRTFAPSLNLVDSTGVINGTPNTAGTSTVHVQVEDSVGTIAQKDLTLSIACTAFSIVSTSPIPNATQGSSYNFQFQSSGGVAPISWIESGTLPTGMSLSTTGVLSGTPINFGTFLFTVTATDSCQPQPTAKQKVFSLTVTANSGPLTITTTSPLPAGTEGSAYTTQLTTTGGTSPYTYAVTSGALPAGLSLSSTGVISGTPTSAGTSNFTVRVTDGIGTTNAKPFALTVSCPAFSITSTTPLPNATATQPYSFQFTSSGGIAPRTWTLASGSLPPGLSLSAAGLLSGTPSVAGAFSFNISVTDSCLPTGQTITAPFSVTVNPAPVPLSITSTSPLAAGVEGVAYSVQLNATGGTAPYTWSVASGTLPTGTTLNASGIISGTPTVAGTFSFTARVTDSVAGTVTKPFTITITCPALSITSTSPLSNGTQGQAYSFQFTASGGILPITWAVTQGALPTGVTLSSSGLLSGTPSVTGTFNFNVTATDSCNPTPQTNTQAFSLTINTAPVPLSIVTNSPLPNGTQGVAYSTQLQAAGGTAPYTWSIAAGTLPAGLTLSSAGIISGTPTAIASTSVTFRVTDAVAGTTTKVLAITITCPTLTLVSTSPLPNGTQNSPYSFQFQASGGIAPYTWTRTGGAFPAGLTFPTSGLLSGTPTASGSFSPVVQVADSCSTPQTASNTFALTIAPAVVPIVINTASPLPAGTVGVSYSTTLSASGGTPPYFWSVISGALPAGLTLSGAGVISGTPTTSQTTTPTIQVTDSLGASTTKAFSITVTCPALAITSTSPLPAGTQNSPYSFQFQSSGGIAPRTWTVISGTLPVGLTLSSAGLLSGTPTGTGTAGFTVQVTDSCSTSQNATLVVSLTINPAPIPLQITTPSPLPPGTVGQAYSVQMAATGGTPPYGTWIVSSGALPSGLTLNTSTGVISGTPTLAQVTTPTIQVQDSVPNTASKPFSITINVASTADNRYCGPNEIPVGLAADGPAQPLQKCVYTPVAGTPSPGSIITVTAGSFSDLQTKATAIACGQTLVIPARNGANQAVYTGHLVLPVKTCAAGQWITIRTDQVASLPPEGTRISPAWVGTASLAGYPPYNQPGTPGIYLPKLINNVTNQSTINCGVASSRWRFIGLEVTSTGGVNVQNSMISCLGTDHMIFDRMLVHGGNNATWHDKDIASQGIGFGTSTYGAVIDSYIGDIHCLTNTCVDSYSIEPGGSGGTQTGPLKTVNNFMSASGETCGLSGGGGQGASSTTLPLSDWEFRRNHCFKPAFWKTNDPSYFGTSFIVKNAFELKNTNRLLVEANLFDTTWGGQSDQFGTLVNYGAKNQSAFTSGNASSNGTGTLTALGAAVFSSTVVSPLCAVPLHCIVRFNGITYSTQTFVDTKHITVSPAPPSSASAAFLAFTPGLNPQAQVSNITMRYNHLIHGSRCLAIFAVKSDGGDYALGDNNISVHDNICDDIDTKWNVSTGSCCAWGSSFQIQNQFPSPNNLHDIWMFHNTALSFQTFGTYSNGNTGPSFGFGFQSDPNGVVKNLKIYDNIGTVGFGGSASVCNTGAASVLQRMQCYDTLNGVAQNTYCFDHNLFSTTTQPPITGATNNPPYPAAGQSPGCGFTTTGQQFVTSFAAIQFTSLSGAVNGNYQLLNTSPGHNAAHDGTDLGPNIPLVNQYLTGVP
jgi:hypothetical protein